MRLQQKASYDGSSCTDPAQRLGVYCHVPFCASSCDFCAFYQEKPRREDLNRYLAGMELEFQRLPRDRPVQTVFLGRWNAWPVAGKRSGAYGDGVIEQSAKPS